MTQPLTDTPPKVDACVSAGLKERSTTVMESSEVRGRTGDNDRIAPPVQHGACHDRLLRDAIPRIVDDSPLLPVAVCDEIPQKLRGDRPWFAVTDLSLVDLDDRDDFRRRSRGEALIGDI